MPDAKNADLTIAAETLWPDDDDSKMHVPPETTASLVSHLASRTGLTKDQISLTLEALATLAHEQLPSHPNRYFVIPGIGAMIAVHRSQERMNPFTKKAAPMTTASLKFKFSNEMQDAFRASIATPIAARGKQPE